MEPKSIATTIALGVTTSFHGVGDITSLVFNPHDDCFYGCAATSSSIIKIKGEEHSQFHKFEGNQVPKAIDFHKNERYFIIVLDGPNPAIYKKLLDGSIIKITEHTAGRDHLEYATGVAINQNTGDVYISSRNDSVHKLTPAGELLVVKPKSWRGALTSSLKGLQGILYDHESDHLLVCDAGSNKIIELDQTTGRFTIFCELPNPFQITRFSPSEYLVTCLDSFKVVIVLKEGEGYFAKPFAGLGVRGTIDGIPSQSRFESPKGIAVNSKTCLVSDTNCIRVISIQAIKQPQSSSSRSSLLRDRDSLNLPSPRQQKADLPIKTLPTRPLYDKLLSPSIRLASTAFQPASKPAATQKSTPSAEPPPLSPRSIIRMKDLSNLELIGEGAQGVVYKAEWTGQTVIYKKVKLQTKTEGEDKKNFQREFSVWQHSTHQSCVSLYGIVNEGNEFGFVAEYCPNGNDKFDKKITLSGMQSIEYAVILANALSVLHAKRITHRDIKSANIMLDQYMKPKLGDFGASKVIHTSVGMSTLVGSLFYMAPEILDGTQTTDLLPASDVYSFGVLLHEIATSKVVKGHNLAEVIDKPEGFSKEARNMWWNLVRDCTQTDPRSRPVMSFVVARLGAIQKNINKFKCKKHEKLNHQIFISYRSHDKDCAKELFEALDTLSHQSKTDLYPCLSFLFFILLFDNRIHPFLDLECLLDSGDWQKRYLYGLQTCQLMVPIISEIAWEQFKSAGVAADNMLREYEHAVNMIQSNQVKVFPWFVGTKPKAQDYPETPHIGSGISIRSTLSEILKHQGARNEGDEVHTVAAMVMDKIKQMKNGANIEISLARQPSIKKVSDKLDIGLVLEDQQKPDHTVQVSGTDLSLSKLRKEVQKQCEVDFEYKFISCSTGSPLSKRQEKERKMASIMDKNNTNRITIRKST